MKTKLIFIGIFFNFHAPILSFGESPKIIFEQNKNQWPSQVKFIADIPGGKLFLEKDFLTYLYVENINWHDEHRNESGGPVTVHNHCIKVSFQNSNRDVEVSGNNLFSWHRNYYIGNDPGKWASNVPLYGQVYYRDLYENIDMSVYNIDQNLKYDIIIHPGGNPKNIKLKYEGPYEMLLQYGHLFLKTSIYDLIEQKPYAYQKINGAKIEVPCSYILNKNTLSFSINGNYDSLLSLIIDPTLIAATYSGSQADNWGYTATYDEEGNIYMGGIVTAAGYPTTTGAFDLTYNGGQAFSATSWPMDISLTKFNPTGTAILFSTYYGGSNNEQPHSLIVSSNNELYVAGRTLSSDFPTTSGAYDQTQNGGYDIIVGKFNSSGNLVASTFVGGSGDDCVNYTIAFNTYGSIKYNYADDGRSEIILDNSSNVYISACTRSTDFPITSGAFDNILGGSQDGCVIKMNSALTSLTFSTYLGGSSDDAAYGLKLDSSNNVCVTGGTASNDFPTTAGVIQQTYQGGLADGFIAVLNNSGTSLLRGTYFGTTNYDQTYLIETDAGGDLYVFGQTKGAYPVTAGVYSNPNSGQFIHKVSGLLDATIFSTVVGTGSNAVNISPTAFLVDSCQSIYISGWGRSSLLSSAMPSTSTTTGLPVTANAVQSITDGADFYFMVLTPNAQSLWYATFYGQNGGEPDHVDGGTSRFDKRAFIYEAVCASCGGGQGFPTTPGAWSSTNNGSLPPPYTPINCNEAVIKMDVAVKPVAVANANPAIYGCLPFTVAFNTNGSLATDFIWDFGDGSPTDTFQTPSHNYSLVGNYTVTLYAIDSIGICGYIDTATLMIYVGAPPVLATSQINLCNGGTGSATVIPTGGMNPLIYIWSPTGQTTLTATGLNIGSYSVTVTDAYGCSSDTSVEISESPPITLTISTVGASCPLSNGTATVNASGGIFPYTFSWSDGQSNSTATGLAAGNYHITVTDANACTKKDSAAVLNMGGASTTLNSSVPATCNGQNDGAINISTSGGTMPYTFFWSNGATTENISGIAAGSFYLTVTDNLNCLSFDTFTVTEPTAITIAAFIAEASCGGSDGSAWIDAGGGTPGYLYSWGGGQTTDSISGIAAGYYSITVSDINGCSENAVVTVNEAGAATISIDSLKNVSCNDGMDGFININATGGVLPYTFLWGDSSTTQNIDSLAAGTYFITVTDNKGCKSFLDTTITQPLPLSSDATGTNETCTTYGTAAVSASGGSGPYTYLWSNGSSLSAINNLSAWTPSGQSTSYTVTVSDLNGCTVLASTIVSLIGYVTANITGDSEICKGGFAILVGGGGENYLWSTGETASSILVIPDSTQQYNMIVSQGSCSDTAYYTVIVDPAVKVNAGRDTAIFIEGSATLNGTITGGTPPFTYSWNPDNQSTMGFIVYPSVTTKYLLSVTDAKGCSSFDSLIIEVLPCGAEVFVPNAFAPGCNCKDSKLKVFSDCIETIRFFIYDRWGEKVFESDNQSKGWDGTYRGKRMNAAAYVYYLKYTTINAPDEVKVMEGNVNLIR